VKPVLAVPFLAGDLRPFLDSIDLDVRLVVIDNSPTGETWDVVPDDAHVIDMPTNIGYTASVNLVIRSLPHEPYWLIANHDTVFAPGDLARLVAAVPDYGWVGINDWSIFALTAETVERVGLWDEHFYNYCSDADYERRCDLAGIRRGVIQGETRHDGSAVIKGYPRYSQANRRSYPTEVAYYCEKWGVPGVRHPGGHDTPFGRGGDLSDDTHFALSRLREQAWT
jgi:GT2 family glycosyltransferase